MRDYKFKVWDKENKEWAADFTLSLDGQLLCDGKALFIRDHFEVIQYLGRKDKNGKEVYEHDILKNEDWNGSKGVFHINPEKSDSCGCCSTIYGITLDDSIEISEVIGNFLESPELLEKK